MVGSSVHRYCRGGSCLKKQPESGGDKVTRGNLGGKRTGGTGTDTEKKTSDKIKIQRGGRGKTP